MSRALFFSLLMLNACLSRDQRDKDATSETGDPQTDDSTATDDSSTDDSAADDSATDDSATDDSATDDTSAPVDADGDGTPASEDCDDADPNRHPGVPEVCDGVDQDCDNQTDEEPTDGTLWYTDSDRDGYGVANPTTRACTQPTGFAANDDDCNDGSATVHPGATEIWQPRNSTDEDCNGYVDEIQVPASRTTLQAALDDTWDGATVLVAAGTYNEYAVVPDFDLLIVSEEGSALTILDASGTNHPVLSVTGSGGANVVTIQGFTLTGGDAISTFGGGGLSCNRANLVGRDLIIEGNTAGYTAYGGGIGIQSCDFTLTQSVVANNTSGMGGGGIYALSPDPLLLENVLLVDNNGGFSGGGIYTYEGTSTLNQVTVVGNSAADSGSGGGIAAATIATDMTITNCVVAYNTSTNQGGGIYAPSADHMVIRYTLAYGNTFNGQTNNVYNAPFTSGNGNVTADPLFTTWSSSTPWTRWDLHLGTGSPAINTGDPSDTDADGTRADMGAYGGPDGVWP